MAVHTKGKEGTQQCNDNIEFYSDYSEDDNYIQGDPTRFGHKVFLIKITIFLPNYCPSKLVWTPSRRFKKL